VAYDRPVSGGASAAAPGPERDAGQADHATAPSSDGSHTGGASPPPAPPPRAGTGATHAEFLITSDERDAAEARLRQAVADEVLSLEEFGDRMRLLLSARTRADLHAAVAGLPSATEPREATARRGQPRPARTGGSAIAIMSSAEIRGRWQPAASTTALAVMGEAVIDLQGVEFGGDVLVINAIAVMGEVTIIVPEGVAVDMRGIALLGERVVEVDGDALPGAPVVQIDGLACMGQVTVRYPRRRERYAPQDGRGAFADRIPLRAVDATRRRGARRPARTSSGRRWVAGALAAVALALPLGWTLSADQVAPAVFGSTTHTVSAAEVQAGDTSVGVPMAFGSVEVQVPEGVRVDQDGGVIFGRSDCEPCGTATSAGPTLQIRTVGAFGSVTVVNAPPTGGG
jgi:hypothetical protein